MERTLTLSFACCFCQQSITATLNCKGSALDEPAEAIIAAISIPCPTCNQVCQLLFDPLQGTVREVRPHMAAQPIPEPSRN
jgi:hypothetical protein